MNKLVRIPSTTFMGFTLKIKIFVAIIFVLILFNILYNSFGVRMNSRDVQRISKELKKESFGVVKFQKIDINNMALGNALSVYYFNIIIATLNQDDFTANESEKDLLKHLPKFISFDDLRFYYNELIANNINIDVFTELYNTDNGNTTTGINWWESTEKTKETINFIMKPLINRIFDKALIASNVKKTVSMPVIHFRCADTPFSKHSAYHLQKYYYFKDALAMINTKTNKTYNSVILLSCSSHNSDENNKKTCGSYTDYLKQYIESINYKVDVNCSDEIEDFATIFYAPGVISTSSSFSFMSGFFGNGIFIGINQDEENHCMNCNDWLYKGYNLSHSFVSDYNNVDDVRKLLL